MNFKDFIHRINIVVSTDENNARFARTIIEAIVPLNERKELLANICDDTFKSYYNGRVSITRLAKKIYASANPRLFEIFILSLNKNQKLAQAFSDIIPEITPDNAAELIADFFYLIIYEAIRPNIQTNISGGGGE